MLYCSIPGRIALEDQLNARTQLRRISNALNQLDKETPILLVLASALAVMIRLNLLDFKSDDFLNFFRGWYWLLRHQGYTVFAQGFSDYNPPYLYVLYFVARWFPNLPAIVAIKIPSILADFVCAGFMYKIVQLKRGNQIEALLAYMATLLSPTVILNGAFWGQTDSIFAAGVLGSLYGLLSKRPWFAVTSFSLALAFKLQAVFFLPFLIALWIRRTLNWKHFLAIPVILFLSIVPAWVIGRPLPDLLTIYWGQTQEASPLTWHAPSLYAWIPDRADLQPLFMQAGIFLAGAIVAILLLLVWKSKAKLTHELVVELASLTVLLVPFVLPEMHERYFFQADLLSIAFAFYFPSYFYIPVTVNMASYLSYWPFLVGAEPFIPEAGLALAILIVVMVMVRKLLLDLYPAPMLRQGIDGGGSRNEV